MSEQEMMQMLFVTGGFFVVKVITMMTPSNSDNKALNMVLVALNKVALNMWKDKNEDAK